MFWFKQEPSYSNKITYMTLNSLVKGAGLYAIQKPVGMTFRVIHTAPIYHRLRTTNNNFEGVLVNC